MIGPIDVGFSLRQEDRRRNIEIPPPIFNREGRFSIGIGSQSPFDFSLGGILGSGYYPTPPIFEAPRLPRVAIPQWPTTPLPSPDRVAPVPPPVDVSEEPEDWGDLPPWAHEPILETRPIAETGRAPDPYPGSEASRAIIDPEGPTDDLNDNDDEENDMAVDWGELVSGTIDVLQGQSYGGGQPVGYTGAGVPPLQTTGPLPSGTYINSQGKLCKHRRRRRALLTEGDFNDLMRIATLPNNANVRTALAKAVGRSR